MVAPAGSVIVPLRDALMVCAGTGNDEITPRSQRTHHRNIFRSLPSRLPLAACPADAPDARLLLTSMNFTNILSDCRSIFYGCKIS
jgi:hypothetical protein